jgi:hypothetical protein
MSDCATQRMRFEAEAQLSLAAAFDGGRIASDGGLLWLSEADSVLGLCEAIASRVPVWRRRAPPRRRSGRRRASPDHEHVEDSRAQPF